MKKKLILFILTFICIIETLPAQSQKRISAVKTMSFHAKETTIVNREQRKSEYDVSFKIPGIIKQVITFPELNNGETYIYNNGEKTIYLPLFKQTTVEKSTGEENIILEVMNYIFEMEEGDENFRKEYYAKRLNGVKLGEKTIIEFKNYKEIQGYLFPTEFMIYQEKNKVGEISIDNMKIDPIFSEKEFIIEK